MQTGGRTDGDTDAMKLIVAFGNFANAPKKTTLVVEHEMKVKELVI